MKIQNYKFEIPDALVFYAYELRIDVAAKRYVSTIIVQRHYIALHCTPHVLILDSIIMLFRIGIIHLKWYNHF
jgi:hypothetical protein